MRMVQQGILEHLFAVYDGQKQESYDESTYQQVAQYDFLADAQVVLTCCLIVLKPMAQSKFDHIVTLFGLASGMLRLAKCMV